MQTDADLVEEVRLIMANTFGVDEASLPDGVAQADLNSWSSLSHLTLLMTLEERFDINFSMREMEAMTSLPGIVAVLQERR